MQSAHAKEPATLRIILIFLSALAFLSTAAGAYLSYSYLKLAAVNEADVQATATLATVKNHLSSFLAEQLKPVRILAGLTEIRHVLEYPDPAALKQANNVLDHFASTLEADVCYLMDKNGRTIASSNRLAPDSFVNRNFSFRPYFIRAIRGSASTYMALGTTSKKRGVYYSFPVYPVSMLEPLGVVVIKASITPIESDFTKKSDATLLLTDPNGIVFMSSRADFLFKSLWLLSDDETAGILQSRQFGKGPWSWIGYRRVDDRHVIDAHGISLKLHEEMLEEFPGWRLVSLRRPPTALSEIISKALRTTAVLFLPLFIIVACAVFFLYHRAHLEIIQRKKAQRALQESEERYRTLYLHTPAMLHSIDPSGRIVSVSDYWLGAMGYTREQVIHRQVTAFMTPESKKKAEETVIPEFLKTGSCSNMPYQFVTNDGSLMDVLLSAIAERDREGNIRRSLAILVDITHQKQVEEELKKTSEELARYSRDLERQVSERTREISGILTHTPAVVYLKDINGCYLLANNRFGELFSVDPKNVRGKCDEDLLAPSLTAILQETDLTVLTENKAVQVEETFPGPDDSPLTFLAVKFPLFDERGNVRGMGGISTDITPLKKAQNQLRRLSASILSGQEKERGILARELHDELGQVLTALRMDAVWLCEKLKEGDMTLSERALTMRDLIDRTIDEVRSLSLRLRPGVLDDLGLLAAIEWLADDFEKRSHVPCTFRHDTNLAASEHVATAIYRITQEALTNVARHAHASVVEILLKQSKQDLTLWITDNGRGFDMKHLNDSEGLGLTGIRERTALAGGVCTIFSEPDKGTKLECSFSLSPEKNNE